MTQPVIEPAPAPADPPSDPPAPAPAPEPTPPAPPAPADPPAPAPAPAPAPVPAPAPAPAPEPAPAPSDPAPAPEADDDIDWSDPAKGKEAKRKANQEARRLKAENETLRQQLNARVDPAESAAAIALVESASALEVARVKAGYKYGIPEEHLGRLRGETAEEIEADAKILGSAFGTGGAGLGRGGLDPTEAPAETDPKKLAAQIPRFH
ncbi:hypothetical protein ACKI1J_24170 [Streptomyces scabiei]|uniref:hypothetical protein n=1 Tax=Streptomyces TaxID=1883 RepID=UPI0038F74CFB